MDLICFNSAMRNLLGEVPANLDDFKDSFPGKLEANLQKGFVEIDGCVVPKTFRGTFIDKKGDDETGVECFLNHEHIELIDHNLTISPLLTITRSGFSYAAALQASLQRSSVAGPFKIILSLDDTEILNCVVRFHRVRTSQHWLLPDLEGYSQPVATIDFDKK